MDEFNQVGPEKPDYAEDVVAIAKKLGRRDVVDVKFAARGTMKHVVLALLPTRVERDRAEDPIFYTVVPEGFADQPGIFVAVDGGKAAWLPATGDLHAGYVQGYLGSPYGIDAAGGDALTDLINGVADYIYGAHNSWQAYKDAFPAGKNVVES